MKYKIVQKLKEEAPGYVSGGELGKLFDVSRTAIWKYIEELRSEGYSIEAVSGRGYRLLPAAERLNAYEIACGLDTKLVGSKVLYFDSLDSTNNYARKIAAEGCDEGTAVVAGRQTAGKGRLGRNWESPPDKGIYVSVVLRPPLAPAETPIITLAAAVAVADAIGDASGLSVGIKWPNDLVIDGRKVCGILVEMGSEADRVNYVIIGIGINYSQEVEDFPEGLRGRAISLKTACEEGGETCLPGRLTVIRSLLRRLDNVTQLVLRYNNKEIIEMWKKRSVTLGRKVGFRLKDTDYTGTAVDVTEDGRLLVACDDGVRRELLSGEVSVRGIYGYC